VPQIRPLADIVHFKYAHTYLLCEMSPVRVFGIASVHAVV